MHALYSLFSKGKKQRDAAGKKREGGVGDLAKTQRHMEMVSISVVAGSSPLSLSVLFLFHFQSFTSQNRNQIATAAA